MNDDALLVLPHERRDGFWANIRGHVLDLADPSSTRESHPTPDDLFIASVASELAWSTRSFLHHDDVSVAAAWRRGLAEINVTVAVPTQTAAASAELLAVLNRSLAARACAVPLVNLSFDGGNS